MSKNKTEIPIIIIKEILHKIKIIEGVPVLHTFANHSLIKELTNLYTSKRLIMKEKIVNDAIIVKTHEYYQKSKYFKNEQPQNGTLLGSLSEIKLEVLAAQINELIQSYPRHYKFIFPIPYISNPEPNLKLKNNIEIKAITEEFLREYGLKIDDENDVSTDSDAASSLLDRYLRSREQTYNIGDYVLEINISGYVTKHGETLKNDLDPLYIFKIIFSYFEIFNVLEINYNQRFKYRNYSYHIFDSISKSIVTAINQSNDTLEFIDSRSFINFNEEGNKEKFKDCISNLEILLNGIKGLSKEFHRLKIGIMNALYWYFEIAKTDNVHLKTIFLSTAIDSFFHGSDTEKIKAEYIASMIGEDLKEQKDIENNLLRLFKERNSIIHGEKQIDSSENFAIDNTESPFVIVHFSNEHICKFIENRINLYTRSMINAKK